MLERLRQEMDTKTSLHQELVEKYNKKMEEKTAIEAEMVEIEKEIIRNQGAIQVINDLGVELMEQEQPEAVIVEEAAEA